MGPDSWRSILRSSETAVTGADAIVGGDRAAYALCRPSGHHARADRGTGFCYLNNSAIAAQRLRSRFGKVAIIDVDVHHGDGTQQIFYNRPDVLTISIHGDPTNFVPFYTGYASETGHGAGEGFDLNLPLPPGAGGAEMNAALDTAIERVRAFGAEALVVALGFDAHRDDPIGILKLHAKDFGSVGDQDAIAGSADARRSGRRIRHRCDPGLPRFLPDWLQASVVRMGSRRADYASPYGSATGFSSRRIQTPPRPTGLWRP